MKRDVETTDLVRVVVSFYYRMPRKRERLPKNVIRLASPGGATAFARHGLLAMGVRTGAVLGAGYSIRMQFPRKPRPRKKATKR